MSGITTVQGASGTIYQTTAGLNVLTLSPAGSDTVYSDGTDSITAGGGSDTIFAAGPSAVVFAGTGNLVFVAGVGNDQVFGSAGADTLFGGQGNDVLAGGTGIHAILVAGSGNTTLAGGAGNSALLYAGSGLDNLSGSTGGNDTLVGGTGITTFDLTTGDLAFGGAATNDTFVQDSTLIGNGTTIVEGNGNEQLDLTYGASTAFGGTGTDTYFVGSPGSVGHLAASLGIVGFKPGDRVVFGSGSAAAVATAVTAETTGAYGSRISVGGATVTFFGVTANASEVLAALPAS